MSKIWSAHIADISRAITILEKFTDKLNKDQPKHSDLTFMVPERIEIQMYEEDTDFALVLEDGAWYLEVTE